MSATTTQTMGTPEAVRLLNETIGQWRQAIKEGVSLEEHASVLAADLEHMAEAMRVITDWCPS